MAILVEEIMNRELFFLRPDERVDDALSYLLSLGIGGAPVVDADRRAVGMLSFRDAAQADSGQRVDDNMNTPVIQIGQHASIDEAARRLAESGYHRLVVTDERGRAVGLVSALDVVRGLVGLPAAHPPTFPHFDAATGLVWTDDAPLAAEHIELAPTAAGVLVLTRGGRDRTNQAVWVEASADLRRRLLDLVTEPQPGGPLARLLEEPDLWFRAAHTRDIGEARHVAHELLRAGHGLAGSSSVPH